MICGIDRSCGKAEIIRAAEECIAYQITDIIRLMEQAICLNISALRVDGGATKDSFLMQFQADIANTLITVPKFEELSAMGPAFAAGIAIGIHDRKKIFERSPLAIYKPSFSEERREKLYSGWRDAVQKVLSKKQTIL